MLPSSVVIYVGQAGVSVQKPGGPVQKEDRAGVRGRMEGRGSVVCRSLPQPAEPGVKFLGIV